MSHNPHSPEKDTKEYELVIDDTQSLTEDIISSSILIKGSLQLNGSLVSNVDDIRIDGNLNLEGPLKAQRTFLVNGTALISNSCTADTVIIKGSLTCPKVVGNTIQMLSKNMSISELSATKSIFLFYYKMSWGTEPVTLIAPEITIRYRSMYSYLMDIPRKVLKVFKKEKKFKKEILLENLTIQCDTLTIETFRIPEDVTFAFSEPEKITAKNIVVKRFKVSPREERDESRY